MARQVPCYPAEHGCEPLGARCDYSSEDKGQAWATRGTILPYPYSVPGVHEGGGRLRPDSGKLLLSAEEPQMVAQTFFFIVDQSMVNSYVVYCSQMEHLGLRVRTHMQFKIAVGKYLVSEWMQARSRPAQRPPRASSPQKGPSRPLSVAVRSQAEVCAMRACGALALPCLRGCLDVSPELLPCSPLPTSVSFTNLWFFLVHALFSSGPV